MVIGNEQGLVVFVLGAGESDDDSNESNDDNDRSVPVLRTDGILLDTPHLPRAELVNNIITTARTKQFVVLGGPPATGKTALLQLVRQTLLREEGIEVVDVDIQDVGVEKLYGAIAEKGIVRDKSKLRELKNTWLLLDDCQNAFAHQYHSFWQFLVQSIQGMGSECDLHIILSTTHDLPMSVLSPVHFGGLAHVHANITEDEAVELFNMFAKAWRYQRWRKYRATLLQLSELSHDSHHVGVMIAGIRMLLNGRDLLGTAVFDEAKADSSLRTLPFINQLDRCFCLPRGFCPAIGPLLDAVLAKSPTLKGEDSPLMPLIRAGILNSHGVFSCLAAQWYYNRRCFPCRSDVTPDSLDALVIEAVKRMSAKRLRDTLDDEDGFPKESTFQHLFNEALSSLMPAENFCIPELNTFGLDYRDGETISGELDFQICGNLHWCLDILRKGEKMGWRVENPDYDGQHGGIALNDSMYLAVDCTGPKTSTRGAQVNELRCTLYFSKSFDSCICRMRTRAEVELRLAP